MSEGLYGYCECGRSKYDSGKYCFNCMLKQSKNAALELSTMKTMDELLNERFPPGTSPTNKELDDLDLEWYERFAGHYTFRSDECGWMSGHILRLVEEIRRLKTPYNHKNILE